MSEWPEVSIVITTYLRTQEALATIKALQENLYYIGAWHWVISDDGSPPEHREAIKEALPPSADILNVNRAGVGQSKNAALGVAFNHSPYVLLLEDDWQLVQRLDLHPHVAVLRDNEDVGMIRFGFLGGELLAKYIDYGSFRSYWWLLPNGGLYTYSGQVSLRKKEFYSAVGMHRTGISPGEEELDMCIRFNAVENAPLIVWPACFPTAQGCGPFRHIGDNSLNSVTVEA